MHQLHPGASILLGGLGEQSPTFLKWGVDRLVISTNLLRLDRQIVAWTVKCAFTLSDGGWPPSVYGWESHPVWGGVRRPCTRHQYLFHFPWIFQASLHYDNFSLALAIAFVSLSERLYNLCLVQFTFDNIRQTAVRALRACRRIPSILLPDPPLAV